jgi:hypothetical protein
MQYEQEFYSPKYESKTDAGSIQDFRTMLYWNPDIKTEGNGKTRVQYYTSNTTGKFVGVLHGITDDGLPATHVFRFEVRQAPR